MERNEKGGGKLGVNCVGERGILGVGGGAEDGLILVLVLSLLMCGMSLDSGAAQSSGKASDLEGKA